MVVMVVVEVVVVAMVEVMAVMVVVMEVEVVAVMVGVVVVMAMVVTVVVEVVDDLEAPVEEGGSHEGLPTPVNLKLEWVLGRMPRKVGSVAALINRLLR